MKQVAFLLVVLPLLLCSTKSSMGQAVSNLRTGQIVELESIESSISGTFVVASMERAADFKTRVLVHRSTDRGQSWVLIDSITPKAGHKEIPDPVLAVDSLGNFYLVIMRVNENPNIAALTADLELYVSLDDGNSWSLRSTPHIQDSIADYPQLIARGNGHLYLVYSHIIGFPLISKSTLNFKNSIDGGLTWTMEQSIEENSLKSIGPDINWAYQDSLMITSGDQDASVIHVFTSGREGDSWIKKASFSIPGGEKSHITKPIAHPAYQHYGVLSHKPHQEDSPIIYHAFFNGIKESKHIDMGAYAQGYMTDDGIIHLIYNQRVNDTFQTKYAYSNDKGQTFSQSVSLYTGTFANSQAGEYQSLMYGRDGRFYLIFCDWSDLSSAKMLSFLPLLTSKDKGGDSYAPKIFPNPSAGVLYLEKAVSHQIEKWKVMDLAGRKLSTGTFDMGQSEWIIDLSGLQRGRFILQLETDKKIWVEMIMIE
ncbi:MAG: T9SS type A sorting domain-containing protein [Bacteroidota bacterium]